VSRDSSRHHQIHDEEKVLKLPKTKILKSQIPYIDEYKSGTREMS